MGYHVSEEVLKARKQTALKRAVRVRMYDLETDDFIEEYESIIACAKDNGIPRNTLFYALIRKKHTGVLGEARYERVD